MRHIKPFSAATALIVAAALATPALAGESRVEGHVSGDFYGGDAQAGIGIAAGHDFTLAPGVFAGPEVSLDKLIASDTLTSFGLSGRVGANIGTLGKLYMVGGWATTPYHGGNPDWDLGGGFQHSLSPGTYAKLEYRHFTSSANGITPARDSVLLGFGAHF